MMRRVRSILFFASLAGVVAMVTSCSSLHLGPEPWERDLLSKRSMQFDALDDGIDDHIYFSKEASSGGRSYGGGGCGCN